MATSYSRLAALAAELSELGGDFAVMRGRYRRTYETFTQFENNVFAAIDAAIVGEIIKIHEQMQDLELAEGAARNES